MMYAEASAGSARKRSAFGVMLPGADADGQMDETRLRLSLESANLPTLPHGARAPDGRRAVASTALPAVPAPRP